MDRERALSAPVAELPPAVERLRVAAEPLEPAVLWDEPVDLLRTVAESLDPVPLCVVPDDVLRTVAEPLLELELPLDETLDLGVTTRLPEEALPPAVEPVVVERERALRVLSSSELLELRTAALDDPLDCAEDVLTVRERPAACVDELPEPAALPLPDVRERLSSTGVEPDVPVDGLLTLLLLLVTTVDERPVVEVDPEELLLELLTLLRAVLVVPVERLLDSVVLLWAVAACVEALWEELREVAFDLESSFEELCELEDADLLRLLPDFRDCSPE